MSAYVKQHYVLRFYLNYFTTPKSQQHPSKKRWQIYVHHTEEAVRLLNRIHVIHSYQKLYASPTDLGDVELAKQMSATFHIDLKAREALVTED